MINTKYSYEDRIQQMQSTIEQLRQQLSQQMTGQEGGIPPSMPPMSSLHQQPPPMVPGMGSNRGDMLSGPGTNAPSLPPPSSLGSTSNPPQLPPLHSNPMSNQLPNAHNGSPSQPSLPPMAANNPPQMLGQQPPPPIGLGGVPPPQLPPYDGKQSVGSRERTSPFPPSNGPPSLGNPHSSTPTGMIPSSDLMNLHNAPSQQPGNGSSLPPMSKNGMNIQGPPNSSQPNTNVSDSYPHIIERPISVNNMMMHHNTQQAQTNGIPNDARQIPVITSSPQQPQQTTVNLFDTRNENVVKKEGNDWVVVFNPQVAATTNLNMSLYHNLDQESVVCCVKFSSCGRYLATGSNKQAIVFDVDSGKKFGTFSTLGPITNPTRHSEEDENDEGKKSSSNPEESDQANNMDGTGKDDSYIRSVCFSPDNKYLVAGADKTVKIWDVDTKQIYRSLEGHELDIYSLDFSPDSKLLVSGSGDGKAKIWDMETGECRHTCGNEEIGPREGVTSVAISPDGRTVATGSLDCVVRLWDMTTGELLESLNGHDDSVYSVAFAPDGKSLASGSLDRTLKIWDVKSAQCTASLSGHRDFVLSVAYSPDGRWLVSGSKDRSVQFWDPRSNILHLMLQGHKNSVISVSLNPKRPLFATGSGDYRARVWKYQD